MSLSQVFIILPSRECKLMSYCKNLLGEVSLAN